MEVFWRLKPSGIRMVRWRQSSIDTILLFSEDGRKSRSRCVCVRVRAAWLLWQAGDGPVVCFALLGVTCLRSVSQYLWSTGYRHWPRFSDRKLIPQLNIINEECRTFNPLVWWFRPWWRSKHVGSMGLAFAQKMLMCYSLSRGMFWKVMPPSKSVQLWSILQTKWLRGL